MVQVSAAGTEVIKVGNVDNVRVAGPILMQAGTQNSPTLLQWGDGAYAGSAAAPGTVHRPWHAVVYYSSVVYCSSTRACCCVLHFDPGVLLDHCADTGAWFAALVPQRHRTLVSNMCRVLRVLLSMCRWQASCTTFSRGLAGLTSCPCSRRR